MESHCHRRSDPAETAKIFDGRFLARFWREQSHNRTRPGNDNDNMAGGDWMVRLGNHSSQVASILLPSNILNSMAVTATSI